MPDSASKSGPAGCCAPSRDRPCPAGQEEQQVSQAALSAHSPQITAPALAHSPAPAKMGNAGQQRGYSKLTLGMLPADHPQEPEFKKPRVSVCTVISSDNEVPSVSVCVLCVRGRFCTLVPLKCFSLTINMGMCRHIFIFTPSGC